MTARPSLNPHRVIHVGDFVHCRSKRYRDSLGLPTEVGLVIEIKRANYKVLYASDKRAWIPREALVSVPAAPEFPLLLQKLHYLLRRVNAHECEIVSADGVHRVSARIDGIDDKAVDDIRAYLGEGFVSLAVVPEGMAFMQAEITLYDPLPPSAAVPLEGGQ
jgi:hypothetical protein